jgi:hypothetical protein
LTGGGIICEEIGNDGVGDDRAGGLEVSDRGEATGV